MIPQFTPRIPYLFFVVFGKTPSLSRTFSASSLVTVQDLIPKSTFPAKAGGQFPPASGTVPGKFPGKF